MFANSFLSRWTVRLVALSVICSCDAGEVSNGNDTAVATPVFSPAADTYSSAQSVSISTATPGATIGFTIDGSTPTETSAIYSRPILVSATTTIKAGAWKTGLNPSAIATAKYTIEPTVEDTVATPGFSPPEGTYSSPQQVTISTATAGATIRCTLDGTDPTTSSNLHAGPITISSTTTLKAKAWKSGMIESAVAAGRYTIEDVTDPKQDKFGIKEIYETLDGGRVWFSKWDNGIARSWPHQEDDPNDPEFQNGGKGDGSFKTDGNGILMVSGSTPRMHIADVELQLNWHDIEITTYFRRVSDGNEGSSGMSLYSRYNHMIDADLCDTRGYAGEFRNDGLVGFEKEVAHGISYARTENADKEYWSNGMPFKQWFGIKFVTYDLPDGNVKLELYMDEKDGADGGTWNKVTEFIDQGNNFGVGETPCAAGIDPALRLTKADTRPGSESGIPNLTVLFRTDAIDADGFWMKKASIREIAPFGN